MLERRKMVEILIVDDKESNLFALEHVLRVLDVEITRARTGDEALRATLNHDFALAILDVQMPGMDGYELARILRDDERTKSIPIIFLSAVYSDEPHVFRGYESGAVDFITKPFSPEVLLSKVRVFLQLKRQKNELLTQNARLETLVSELQRTQEMLKRSHDELELRVRERTLRLEQSNRELEDFAFVASHDLQEPLRKIRTFADLLLTTQKDTLAEKGRDYLDRITRASGRMQDLITDLLRYSRMANPGPLGTASLKQSVQEAIIDLQVLIDETRGTVIVGELPTIEADHVQMRQLFQNLIGNALKYHGEPPPVVEIYRNSTCPDGSLEIHVKDNGIGFDECFLDKIFKPFQRLHGQDAPFSGTGMGLAITRRIVERHNGSITARSEPGKGTLFIVRLPATQQRYISSDG